MSDDQTEAPSPYVFELELPDGGTAIRWRSPQEGLVWINDEWNRWRWLTSQESSISHNLKSVFGTNVEAVFNSIRQSLTTDHRNYQDIEANLKNLFSQHRLPRSSSSSGQFYLRWAEKDEISAGIGLACRMEFDLLEIEPRNPRQFSGRWFAACQRAALWESGWMPDNTALMSTANETVSRWNSEFDQRRQEFDKAAASVQTADRSLAEARKEWDLLQRKWAGDIAEQTKQHETAMHHIEQSYRDDMAVRTAVEYWSDRKTEHTHSSIFYGRVAMGWGLFAAVASLLMALYLGEPSAAVLERIESGAIAESVASGVLTREWVGSLGRMAVLTLFLIWPLRIVVRNYLSNSHLAADAAERVVIVQTYLALLNDPALQNRDDLKQHLLPPVLQNVFRHAADGIVKDDAWPWQTIVDAIKQKPGG